MQNASFPVDNTQFTSIVEEAKASGADIVLVDAITPQAMSIRKQMASAGDTPKVLDIEKGAEPVRFATALGKLADGVIGGGYRDPSFPYPGSADLAKDYETETGQGSSQHIADSYVVAEVLLDAIAAAGKTDPAAINAAIAKTDKTDVVGPIKFDATHTAELPIVRRGIGRTYQIPRPFLDMTVEENLAIAARGVSAADRRHRLDHVYALFPDLAERRSSADTAMSGGQQQMLAIGHALMARPRLAIFDEISLGLAPVMMDRLHETLGALRAEGLTMLVIEQDVDRALQLADRVHVIERGCFALSGTADEIRSDARLRHLYIGEAD